MDCACLVHKTYGYYNNRVYVQLIRSTTGSIFEGGNTVPDENVYILKINLQKSQEITEIQRRELKSYNIQETIALQFVLEKHVGKAFIFVENLRQSWNQSRHHKRYIFERALYIRGAYFHVFQTNGQIGHTCVAPKN